MKSEPETEANFHIPTATALWTDKTSAFGTCQIWANFQNYNLVLPPAPLPQHFNQ